MQKYVTKVIRMDTLINRFVKYIDDILGILVVPEKWSGEETLPLYMRERFTFYQVQLLPYHTTIILCADNENQTPMMIKKHLDNLATRTNGILVYLRDTLNSYDRKRLIEKKIPFVIPGKQMYMPFLGIDLREYFGGIQRKNELFGPATQFLLLYLLQNREVVEVNPVKAANILGYTKMTMTRAFQELQNAGIGEYRKYGKEKYLHLSKSKRIIWQSALPFLQNPVQKKVYVRSLTHAGFLERQFSLAGESALSRFSMLAEPHVKTYAIQKRLWISNRRLDFEELQHSEENTIELELWRYPTRMADNTGMVDKLSLYLSLKENPDERVQAALNTLLEETIW